MQWQKQGCIFHPHEHGLSWVKSHAGFPTPILLDNIIRIYYSPRVDYNGTIKSVVSFFDVDANNPQKVVYVNPEPVFEAGKLGAFDDSGVQPNCAIHHDGKIYLYYLGWCLGVTVMARNNTGLAISEDGGRSFTRAYEGPIISPTKDEAYFAYTPCVIKENDTWHAWYGSGTGWVEVNGKAEGLFETKYACSQNGIDWHRPNITCIKPKSKMEVNCRPAVIKKDDVYHMWFSLRSAVDFRGGEGSYGIGYATSTDGKNWQRIEVPSKTIAVSKDGWDSQMVCFCGIVEYNNKLHMFYNGNGFGSTGIGYAVCDWA